MKLTALCLLAGIAPLAAAAPPADPARCDAAWAAYRDLQAKSVMEASQYPLTQEGAEVRAACGREALPAAVDADVNPTLPRVMPTQPPPPPAPGSAKPIQGSGTLTP